VSEDQKKPLTKSAIARAIGCSPAVLSRGRFKNMPKFYSLDEFKLWDLETRERGTPKFEMTDELKARAGSGRGDGEVIVHQGNVIEVDWRKFETTRENHLDVTLARAENISNMAYALLDKAIERNDIASTFGAIKNWSSALREECEVRDRLLEQQKASREVIGLDEVKHVHGMVIQELVGEIESALIRGAIKANPDAPDVALRAYQAEFDDLKMRIQESMGRIESELTDELESEVMECAD
jgi:hypothetical protein